MSLSITLAQRLKQTLTKRAEAIEGANKILSKASAEDRPLSAEENTEFEKRHADAEQLLTSADQIEKQMKAEASLDQPMPDHRRAGLEDVKHRAGDVIEDDGTDQKAIDEMEMTNFRAFVRGGMGSLPPAEQEKYKKAFASMDPEMQRTLATTSASAGGALVPQGFVRQIESAMLYYGGIIDAADYIDTDDGAALPWPTDNDTGNDGEMVAEGSNTAVDEDPTFGAVTFNAYLLSSKIVKVPIQLLQDSAFDLDVYLRQKLAERIARQLNSQATTANGSSTINGVVTAATAGPTIFPATSVAYSDLIDLEYSVNASYRTGPKVGYMMHDSTIKVIRKLTDDSNNPIFRVGQVTEGLATNREPDTLNGYKLWRNNDMATPAQGAKTILFGDFSKYKIRRVRGMALMRLVEKYAEYFQVGFLAFQRFDGDLVDAGTHPIKYLTQGAS